MELRFQDWFTNILGVQSVAQFGAKQVRPEDVLPSSDVDCSPYLKVLPASFSHPSVVFAKDNLAVVPDDFTGGSIISSWLNSRSGADVFTTCISQMKQASFIALHDDFLSFIGQAAHMEMATSFSGIDAEHVHEAPIYIPGTNELIFADTSVVGWLWTINVETHERRQIVTKPYLNNVNGGTLHDSRLYFTTNGGTARAIYNCSLPSDPDPETGVVTSTCEPVVNNYRLAHLNSPNDLIFTSVSNILFTDPPYGWAQSWPGIEAPELPSALYHFDTVTRALVTLDHSILHPNGLALSSDEKTLYVADSNSTSGKPISVWDDSVRNVYAFDWDESRLLLSNKRLVHVVERGWPDGLRITQARDGKELLLAAGMGGVDVVDVSRGGAGVLLGKFNVGDDVIFNLEPVSGKSARAGKTKDKGVWLLTGRKGVYKVTIAAG